MPKKLSTDFVKRQIRKYGGSVKKNWEYVNNRTLIDIKCSQGHKFSMRYADISQGHWCPYCYGNGQPTTKEVKNFLRKKGGKTLRNWEYVNNRSPIKIQCEKGHVFWNNWTGLSDQNQWCPTCFNENRGITLRLPKRIVLERIRSYGYNMPKKRNTSNMCPVLGGRIQMASWRI